MAAPNVKRRFKPISGRGRSRPLSIRQMKREEAISDDEGMEIVVRENNEDDSTRDGGGEDSSRDENLSLVPFGSLESSKNSKVCEAEDDDGEGGACLLRESHGTRSLSLIPFGLPESSNRDHTKGEVVTRNKVRETLRLFQAICRKLLQEEESKVKVRGEQPNIFRIDLAASKLLREKRMWVNTGKPILGVVPGVEVGDEFQYRVELAIVGIHRPFQGGIDFLKKGKEILATVLLLRVVMMTKRTALMS
ncbi:Histone-lysine N-methyltransferase, H3 lysine-9 specific SUVH6 [Acorus calamus]|uniref:Histone-lysine N-methyltransferase, H3 lysine-9 specific SUVH6 n=1 Tax=Acorus calamus TaxID=4465 RepID=A0AAV9E1M8_ACOCL|nr:Histone-lysine N-methyltransferase, H3 lysine-9 specific SUVH6 [Acorus calamus]